MAQHPDDPSAGKPNPQGSDSHIDLGLPGGPDAGLQHHDPQASGEANDPPSARWSELANQAPTPLPGRPGAGRSHEEGSIFDAPLTGRYPRPDTNSGAANVLDTTPATGYSDAGHAADPHASGIDLGALDLHADELAGEASSPSNVTSGIDFMSEAGVTFMGSAGAPGNSVDSGLDSGVNLGDPPANSAARKTHVHDAGASEVDLGGSRPATIYATPEEIGAALGSSADVRVPPSKVPTPTIDVNLGGARPTTQHALPHEMDEAMRAGREGGPRPATQFALPAQIDALLYTRHDARPGSHGESDSSIDLGSRPSVPEIGAVPEPAPATGRVSTSSDSDIDIDLTAIPEPPADGGSGLHVNPETGRLVPTHSQVDLDLEAEEVPPAPRSRVVVPVARQPESAAAVNWTPWVGGSVGGAVVGAGLLWICQSLFGGGTAPVKPSTAPVANVPVTQPIAQAPAASAKFDLLKTGDLDQASAAGIEQVEEGDPAQVAQRGEFRWLSYLRKQMSAGAAPRAADVKPAADDLQAAADKGNIDALYWLGQLQESVNETAKAKATYAKGLAEAPAGPQKQRFEAALDRLELKGGDKSTRAPAVDALMLTALLLVQEGAPAAEAKPMASEEEAGAQFWRAARLARDGKYAEALEKLDKARALHESRRLTRLRKAQNPLSDPLEEIFLQTTAELKAYWALEQQLKATGYRDIPSLAAELKKESDAAKALEEKATIAEKAATTAKAEAVKAGEVAKEFEQKSIAAEENAAKLTRAVTAAEAKASAAAVREKASEGEAAKATQARQVVEGRWKKLSDELVAAKLLDAKAGPDAVVNSVRDAIKAATSTDQTGALRAAQMENAKTREMLDKTQKQLTAEAQELADSKARLADSQKLLADKQKQLAETADQLADSKKALGDSQQQLTDSKSRIVALREQLARRLVINPSDPKTVVAAASDPAEAERAYSIGLRQLYASQYSAAESSFQTAVSADGQDARYFYFLGLARFYQQKKEASEDFEQGARLEQLSLPPRVAVNAALERVQGPARAAINAVRSDR